MNSAYQTDHYTVEWLNGMRAPMRLPEVSPFGAVVATILKKSLGMIYNQPKSIYKAEWGSTSCIEVLAHNSLATFDFDGLTQLVIQCHEACVRMEIDKGGPQFVKLRFHDRAGRTGRMFDRHPTIEDAIIRARTGHYPKEEEANHG